MRHFFRFLVALAFGAGLVLCLPPTSAHAQEPAPAADAEKPGLSGKVNINTATADELARLPQIGPTLAQRIVEARAKKPFKRAAGLLRVRGIGRKTLVRLKPYVTVKGPTTLGAS